MKLAIVLMLTFCLALQTQEARKIDDENEDSLLAFPPPHEPQDPSSNEDSKKQNDPFLRGGCVQDFCAWPFKRCCPGKNKNQYVYCLAGKCLRITSKIVG